jgi:3-isopropylmalate dehydrogenase
VSKKPAKTSYKIAVMGGDGTGPEVVNEGLKVLKALGQIVEN